MNLVFVYGTLKSGYHNNELLKDSKFIGMGCSFKNEYNMYCNGSFPYITLDGSHYVSGEVYEVDQEAFDNLDRLEGYPHFYDRIKIPVAISSGIVSAWLYFVKPDDIKNVVKIEPHHNICTWRKNEK